MKTRRLILLIAAMSLFCLPMFGCGSDAVIGASAVTDSLGRQVDVPEGAETFVCIGPGCLRLYCYAADTSKLVGVEDIEKDGVGRPYLMACPELLDLDVIGAGGPNNAPDAEKLLVAGPDVIFTTYNSDASAADELQQKTGIPVVVLSYGATAVFDPEVEKSIKIIAGVTGNEKRADEVIAYLNELKADLESRTADIDSADKPSVYIGAQSMRGAHGIESTSGNFSLFNAIGAKNVVDEAGIGEYVMLDKEALLEMDPEIIFIDAGGFSLVMDDYKTNPIYYQSLRAVKSGKLFLELPYNNYSTNIEIAIADAYYMGSILYPEQFSDVDPAAKFDEITNVLLGADLYEETAEDYFGGFQQATLDK